MNLTTTIFHNITLPQTNKITYLGFELDNKLDAVKHSKAINKRLCPNNTKLEKAASLLQVS